MQENNRPGEEKELNETELDNVSGGAYQAGLDSLSEMSQTEQMRMQTVMDQKSKLDQALSVATKKAAQTNSTIVQNLK